MEDGELHSKNPATRPLNPHTKLALQIAGVVLTALGVIGIILPVMPGVPLLILAAACFARSSPRLEHWLVTHPVLGPGIVAWRENGAIPTRVKIFAIGMMAVSAFLLIQSDAPTMMKLVVLTALAGSSLFVGTRPNA
ncbi:MAG: YbaN family protein [Marinicaulis sp.]|nr:YbaN family protein [Marinicaulis sp.]